MLRKTVMLIAIMAVFGFVGIRFAKASVFNPLNATNSQLMAHGYPIRPGPDSGALSDWIQAMEHAKKFVKPTYTPLNKNFGYYGKSPTSRTVNKSNVSVQ